MAVLIIGVIYAVFASTVRVRRDQQARRAGPLRTAEILHQLSDDLVRAWLPEGENQYGFRLEDADDGSAVTFLTRLPAPHDPDLRWAEPVEVEYRVQPTMEGPALLRVHRALAGPGAAQDPITNRLARVDQFRIQVFDGTEWQSEFTTDESDVLPVTARLTLDLPDDRGPSPPMTTEVVVPAGMTVSSTLQRSGGGTPPGP